MLRGASPGSRPRPAQGQGAQEESYHADARDDDRASVLTFDPSDEEAEHAQKHQHPQHPQHQLPPLSAAELYRQSPQPHDLRTSTLVHQQHRRQQTAPTLPALRIGASSVSHPRGHSRHQSEMALTGDGRLRKRRPSVQSTHSMKLSGWWSGSAAPSVAVDDTSSASFTPTSRLQPPLSATSAPAGFFASFRTRLGNNSAPPTPSQASGDELFNMSIDAALRPPEGLAGRDAFSPAAYKNLQMNAHGLLTRMQDAYRQRTIALSQMEAERDAEREEADEARLRVENLKMQLEHMAQKADEQQEVMKQLVGELEAERRSRQEEYAARDKILGEGSMVTEDLSLDEDERKKWRKSNGSGDVSIDTDLDSVESESVFSRSRSPTIMTSATESHFEMSISSGSSVYQGSKGAQTLPQTPKAKSPRDLTALQKLMKNVSGDATKEDGQLQQGQQMDSCANCHGQDASVAWDTVSLLRDENRGLKHRVAELEVVVDGALDMVNGIGM